MKKCKILDCDKPAMGKDDEDNDVLLYPELRGYCIKHKDLKMKDKIRERDKKEQEALKDDI